MKPKQKYDASYSRKKSRKTITIDGVEYKYEDASTFKQTYHWQRSNTQTTAKRTNKKKWY